MARRSGLGKGLGALIPPEAVTQGDGSAFREVPVSSVTPNPYQPRRHFDEEALASLSASIRELGVLQPLLVRMMDTGEYQLIAGERRWRAAKRAGLPTVPVIVKDIDDLASLEQAVVENLHRRDLNPLEEAAAYQQLLDDFSMTHDQLATRVGKSRASITNTLRLFQLPATIQRFVAENQISAGHARTLLSTPDRDFQEKLAQRIVSEGLSVRAVEDEIRIYTFGEEGMDSGTKSTGSKNASGVKSASAEDKPQTQRLRQAGLHELEVLLSEHLLTSVVVEEKGKRGRVIIDFADLNDLERIYRAMVGQSS